MSKSFGEGAQHLSSVAAQILGWRPAEFWQTTPAELAMALRDPRENKGSLAPSRTEITQMMERDSNG
ncbi:MAG: phage tail assembly chaperone [Pseudomonadota bacterium]